TNAHLAWSSLQQHYEQIGPIAQTLLIQKLLQVHYHRTEYFATTSFAILDDMQHVFFMGLPTKDMLMLIIMMNMMSMALPSVWDHIADCIAQSTTLHPYTSLHVRLCLDVKQQFVNAVKVNATPGVVLVITPVVNTCHTHKTCKTWHTADKCFHNSGGHTGRQDAILAEKAVKHTKGITPTAPNLKAAGTVKGSSTKPSSMRYATNGHTYFVDPDTNEAFLLSSNMPTAATQEFVSLASDITTPAFLYSLPDSKDNKYDALLADLELAYMSLNW
ncbi:hypothetical protein PAXRUDRAFT_102828, partial [Paxillus rubicundulus Ve08.2h10]